ncbi:uncharacterized protein LOC121242478 [Juglans microcarpa x Juglans regia]|uniref:uncharacterized protein LOC121242478 n=1 Tax=Juglans microcarpa x Juglans regia TaxID=2249226 RepID=UPI001B7E2CBE|nr:uncharacterized protein LOC121242478 [Juglans microcarpa x Juglans regia]
MDMMAFTLVIAARRLRPYFQTHPMKVLIDTPLKKILQRPDTSGHLMSDTSDFVPEFANFLVEILVAPTGKSWLVFLDYSSCWAGGGVGVHIITESGEEHNYAIKLTFKLTNNVVEYKALLTWLSIARMLRETEVEFKADSQVLNNQVWGEFAMKGEKLKKYLQLVREKRNSFRYFHIQQVPMKENQKTDKLAQAMSGQEDSRLPEHTIAQKVNFPSIEAEVSIVWPREPKMALDMIKYLDTNEVPSDKGEARKVRNRATCFMLIDGVLYRRGLFEPLLRWVSSKEIQYVLIEIHKGIFGNHSGGRALAEKVMRVRYYWPHTLKDAEDFVRRCSKCQHTRQFRIAHQKSWYQSCPHGLSRSGGWIKSDPYPRAKEG